MQTHLSRETDLSVTSVTSACKIRVERRRKFLPKHTYISILRTSGKILATPLTHTVSNKYLFQSSGSVGKSADSAFLSASVDDPDDAFVGFTYVPPTEDLHE